MYRNNLEGTWQLTIDPRSENPSGPIKGTLPGCNYLDLMAAGKEDPFYGTNENTATEWGHHDHSYTRKFIVSSEELTCAHLEFVGDGIDTVAKLLINGQEAGYMNNFHRTWRFDIKNLVHEGENEIELSFRDPYAYASEQQAKDAHLTKPSQDKSFIRKPPCHFGWDWGPKLAPTGVARSIEVEAYDARIMESRITQKHENGKVTLSFEVIPSDANERQACEVTLTRKDVDPAASSTAQSVILTRKDVDPAASSTAQSVILTWKDDRLVGLLEVEDPRIWWPNGLGDQPLYDVRMILKDGEIVLDEQKKQIGLRTIALDTSKDEDGEQFRFIVNGVPIFVKGADWIPADSFITRADRKTLEFYIKATADGGMNMLRVWGGGMYESEDFYDLCDQYGVLVWQDFVFACAFYPFWNLDFLKNVCEEVKDNVRRLRHRASLALWCGNNEIDVFFLICKDKTVLREDKNFFYLTLRDWVNELDGVTPYWPGSPSSGHIDKIVQNFRKGKLSGDSHLWDIWHGMRPIEDYRTFPTRFCSEFGMESMPAMKTIRRINPAEKPDLFDDVMLLHQKSIGGNSKIMYYLLQKYRNPAKFEDFVYLSQINQSNAMRFATECWKRNIGRQNGAILWQLNDCWPVASWAIVDYDKQYKATLYNARHYNKMQMVSNDYYEDRSELYVINEKPSTLSGTLIVELADFSGNVCRKEEYPMVVGPVASLKVCTVSYEGLAVRDLFLRVRLVTAEGKEIDQKTYLLVPDKEASLPKAEIDRTVEIRDGKAFVTLSSKVLARYVFLDCDLTHANWSDNYFDLLPGEPVTVSVALDDEFANATEAVDIVADGFASMLQVKSLTDVEPAGTEEDDKKLIKEMWKKDKNWVTYYGYKAVVRILSWKSRKD
ncbi:MAG: glycoside hydrolase family 2 protein [Firmicutes bacterium]|nr:glycoside hydrolase family 2 protein [Bacillota bacterium]